MYKSTLILFFAVLGFTTLSVAADQDDYARIFKKYVQQRNKFFATSITKQNLDPLVQEYLKNAEAAYAEIGKLEQEQAEEELLSREGNQIVYEIELMKPLADFAKTAMSASNCKESVHDMNLNGQDSEPVQKAIASIFKKLCR